MSRAHKWPNVQPAREQLYKALHLLDDATEDSLREAREICARLADNIPYIGPAPHCGEYRRRLDALVCTDRACGRCAPVRTQHNL